MWNFLVRQSKRIAFVAIGALLIIPTTFPARAQTVQVEIGKPGIYSLDANRGAGTPPQYLQATTVIPAEVGREFGFEFSRVGPDTSVWDLTLVTEFPTQGIVDPDTQKTVYRDERNIRSVAGRRGYQGYKLDSPGELVPGTWTFKILYRDQLLASQSFTLVSP